MSNQTENILQMLKEKISTIEFDEANVDVGKVFKVGDGIAFVRGLDQVLSGEMLRFNDEVFGLALNLEENQVGVVLLGNDKLVKEGDVVYRTNHIIEVGVGDALLGRVVNALGQPIDGQGPVETVDVRPIERVAPGVMTRKSVHEPLHTGIKVVDSMIPIGKGQRELIIGDRQTGKTSIALNAILNQKGQNVKCIYVAIGQKASTVAMVVEKLKEHDALDYTVVVSSTASELAPLQYLAPYTGCAIGEHWMDNGEDVLIVYDDLSKHAVAYRTISLLLRRPAGREAYPGDVFYLHSRLLERSAKLNENYGGGSMTALPIIETQAGDISAYIPTNVISITDGQLFLNLDSFNSGVRPAVDSGMSVSRVGSAAQTKAMKHVASSLKLELATYHELLSFAQFSSDIDEATQKTIDHGRRLTELLKQGALTKTPHELMIISMFLNKYGYLDQLEVKEVLAFEKHLHGRFVQTHADVLERIKKDYVLDDALIEDLKTIIDEEISDFKAAHHA
ncbi:F0F1 ATP synthase subunit alpha [Erysipelothrix amsterdamensis]|uniref:ATP synthase subunit alpha n=1 Tax=Erysipelothrix amsterdamensis TaxID=2929157 RepID=A0AAU9VHL5_9FIRM|nr:F0F1 ATP synthase subunit alpha [Erysipelothrix sp. 4322-04]WRB86374.1 F0F1 ATP synthase subunit alpha [Erysipelothrix sp. 4322-04]CAH2761405.1 F0F1 ATP synthase subunit alpha [Erysipelothrix sp. A18Y020d]CAH2761406.1 F0F1 ATP synthase subunit alpha [Erysipelothrix sp. A18Y020d]